MQSADVRRPAVAGQFYPRKPDELRDLVTDLLGRDPVTPRAARGVVAPHAGLVYSGRCAAMVFRQVVVPPVTVILAPNHTGYGSSRASLWKRGSFVTPIGTSAVAEAFAEALAAECSLVAHDPAAHLAEHAIEVELPFLQALAPETTIVPLVLAWDDWARSRTLADALAGLIGRWPQPVLLVASSDMTHYEPATVAARKDHLALAAIEGLDGERLLEICHRERVTMCGRTPAAVVLEASRQLGATRATVVDYRHSGMVTGDDSSVVAYAGVVIA